MYLRLYCSASILALAAMTAPVENYSKQTLTETYLAQTYAHGSNHAHVHVHEDAAEEPAASAAPLCSNGGSEHLNCYVGKGFFVNSLEWAQNLWKIGKPIYDAYRPKLCEECTMDPWIVLRRLKQIMDCKINCQPPYLFKPNKSGPARPVEAVGQGYDEGKPIPYDP